jgi:hypothetical protein
MQGNKGPPVFTYVIYRDSLTARNKEYFSVSAAPRLPDTWGLYIQVKPTVNEIKCKRSWRHSPKWARPSSFTRFLDHTQRRKTVGRTPLDEWSARRWDLYLTTHNTHNRLTSIPTAGFEPTISAGEWPQTYALRAPYSVKQICTTACCKTRDCVCTRYDKYAQTSVSWQMS